MEENNDNKKQERVRYTIVAHSLEEAEEKLNEAKKEIDNVLANVDIVFI